MDISQKKLKELMRLSIKLSKSAHSHGNSPFGCVLADLKGNILVEAENTTNTDNNPVAHAEINAIQQLAKKLNSKKFKDIVIVSYVQSCPMCFSALYRSGVRVFVYGCAENNTLVPKIDVHELNKFCNPQAKIISGVLEDECLKVLKTLR